MSDQPGGRLLGAKRRLENGRELAAERVDIEDRLKSDAYRLEYLQGCTDELAAEIERLENPGFLGTLQSLFASPLEKIEHLRSEQYELQRQADELAREIESMRRRLEEINSEVEAGGDADADYAALLAGAERVVLDRGDETSARLQALIQDQGRVREQLDRTRLTLECAEAVLQRVDGMSQALSRLRKRRLPTLDVVSGALNVLQAQATKPSIQRVHRGLEELHRRLSQLDTSPGTDADVELMRLAAVLEGLCVDFAAGRIGSAFGDCRAAFPVEDEVREVIKVLQEKIGGLQADAERFDREKRSLVESAA